jgi:hypothetical protein
LWTVCWYIVIAIPRPPVRHTLNHRLILPESTRYNPGVQAKEAQRAAFVGNEISVLMPAQPLIPAFETLNHQHRILPEESSTHTVTRHHVATAIHTVDIVPNIALQCMAGPPTSFTTTD